MKYHSYKLGKSVWAIQKLTHKIVGKLGRCSKCGQKKIGDNIPGKKVYFCSSYRWK